MSTPIIEVQNLSKVYTIGHQQQAKYQTLRDSIYRIIRKPWELITGRSLEHEELWALKGVSFEVNQGEIVGVIGRNGSGKSTFLKILSRITDPTEGQATLHGRVASLLEVGTGFHPELTGRENIFLNGAILGMRRREIEEKFDQIIEFAGVERFLDTPVKFYSSGMYVRLAFSVAAHLEPDILIVDEVLAVGDVDFQERSLGKMREVTQSRERTVLFVSHNLSAIQAICDRVVVLDAGKLVYDGDVTGGIAHYLGKTAEISGAVELKSTGRPRLRFERLELRGKGEESARGSFIIGEAIHVDLDYQIRQAGSNYQLAVELWNEEGVCLFTTTSFDADPAEKSRDFEPGKYRASLELLTEFLREGRYHLSVSSSIPGVEMLDEVDRAISFGVEAGDEDMKRLGQNRNGALYQRILWKNQRRTK